MRPLFGKSLMAQRPSFLIELTSFISFGIFIVLGLLSFVLLSYLILAGALLGLIVFLITLIKAKFFPSKQSIPIQQKGQTFDHDEFK